MRALKISDNVDSSILVFQSVTVQDGSKAADSEGDVGMCSNGKIVECANKRPVGCAVHPRVDCRCYWDVRVRTKNLET